MSEPDEATEPTGQDAPEHRDDGLDLARAMARSTAGTTPPARWRRSAPRTTPRRAEPGSGDPGAPGADGTVRPTSTASARAAAAAGRDPRLVGEGVARIVRDRGWDLDLRIRSVFARWGELVGEEVSEHSTPESFDDGRLVVRAHSTPWATQLRMLAPSLVRRLCEDLGEGTVTVVEVIGPRAPGWTRTRLSTRDSRGPRDTYG